jgi:hypothetical protein
LARGLTDVANLLTITQALPGQLIAAGILRAPAKSIRSAKDRLTERARGRYVSVLPADAPDLLTNWPDACTHASSHPLIVPPSLDQPSGLANGSVVTR